MRLITADHAPCNKNNFNIKSIERLKEVTMSSEIEIVNLNNFEKIQNFLNDNAYKEILENSENFNTRLCIERRLRMPFLDPQTGVAQTHCALFMKQKQRMPGFREGQIYTYPTARWRKPKRQYLLNPVHSYRAYQYREPHHHHSSTSREHHQNENSSLSATDGNSMGAHDNDSKDSHANAEKEWFHEDLEMSHYHHHDDFEEDFESDNDLDESYSSRGKRKRGGRSRRSNVDGTPRRGRKGGTGGRRRRTLGLDGDDGGTPERRRRGGNNSGISAAAAAAAAATAAAAASLSASINACHSNSASPIPNLDENSQSTLSLSSTNTTTTEKLSIETPETSSSNPPTTTVTTTNAITTAGIAAGAAAATATTASSSSSSSGSGSPKKDAGKNKLRSDREIAPPSPYCDFCLGDQKENKKTNLPEELVSCSDCGRSGHPSCLQFTPNMIVSVKRYRWQCIECKYCSICGTSDNDDQLLFCDDCDRGYHMYCLSPPLITPPEGSWSCKLCLEEFHKEEKAS